MLLPDLPRDHEQRMGAYIVLQWLRGVLRVKSAQLRQRSDLLAQASLTGVLDLGAQRVRSALRPLASYLLRCRPDALVAAMWPLTSCNSLAAKVARFRGNGSGAWIGSGAILFCGVLVGKRAVGGAIAVVRSDNPGEAIAAGVPARIAGFRRVI